MKVKKEPVTETGIGYVIEIETETAIGTVAKGDVVETVTDVDLTAKETNA